MTTKIPFDAELWKTGKYDVVTRDDEKVLSLCVHDIPIRQPINAYLNKRMPGDNFSIDGVWNTNGNTSEHDLFLIPKTSKAFIPLDKHDAATFCYESMDECLKDYPDTNRYHIIEVELPS